jgi:hypothetical protein
VGKQEAVIKKAEVRQKKIAARDKSPLSTPQERADLSPASLGGAIA